MVNEQSVMAVIRATRPTFRNDNDKVAFAVHAIFLASGCVLTATGPPAFTDAAFSSPSKGITSFLFIEKLKILPIFSISESWIGV